MSKKPIIVPCVRGIAGRHRWRVVWGVHSSLDHLYTERKCVYCGHYESEVR